MLNISTEENNPQTSHFKVFEGTKIGGQIPKVSCLAREEPSRVPLARTPVHHLPEHIILSVRKGLCVPRKPGHPHSWK